ESQADRRGAARQRIANLTAPHARPATAARAGERNRGGGMRRNLWISVLAVVAVLAVAGSATRKPALTPATTARIAALATRGEWLLGRAELELMAWKIEAPPVPP